MPKPKRKYIPIQNRDIFFFQGFKEKMKKEKRLVRRERRRRRVLRDVWFEKQKRKREILDMKWKRLWRIWCIAIKSHSSLFSSARTNHLSLTKMSPPLRLILQGPSPNSLPSPIPSSLAAPSTSIFYLRLVPSIHQIWIINDFVFLRILKVPTEELQHRFDIELPESVKQLFTYARNFVEFCAYQALHHVTTTRGGGDYLSDPELRLLTYDMMLAWESPSVQAESDQNVRLSFPFLLLF